MTGQRRMLIAVLIMWFKVYFSAAVNAEVCLCILGSPR
jgi:hypothetical protein